MSVQLGKVRRKNIMSSVTARIKMITQPRGGYISPSNFKSIALNDGAVLNPEENIHASIIGLAVEYLMRFLAGSKLTEAFWASIRGVAAAEMLGVSGSVDAAKGFLSGIKGLDDQSIINACKLVTFDVYFRNTLIAFSVRGHEDTNPDKPTIQNIKILTERCMRFLEGYGPVVKFGFTFEPGGYTQTVDAGDGDLLTENTLWDLKVSKSRPASKQTLQLAMYWIMGRHSGRDIFRNITRLGIFNPRLNMVYLLDTSDIPDETIATIENEVICY